jgi:hypothetical protein
VRGNPRLDLRVLLSGVPVADRMNVQAIASQFFGKTVWGIQVIKKSPKVGDEYPQARLVPGLYVLTGRGGFRPVGAGHS